MAEAKTPAKAKAPAKAKTPENAELLNQLREIVGSLGFTIAEDDSALRTSEQKVKGLDAAAAKTSKVDPSKTLFELATGDAKDVGAAVQGILYIFERSLNVDFIREATLEEVMSGAAHQRAALSPWKESPHLVDDRIIPDSINDGTGIEPPNIPVGQPIPGEDSKADKERAASDTGDLAAVEA